MEMNTRAKVFSNQGSYEGRRFVSTLTPRGFVFGSLQPASLSDIESLPEGRKERITYNFVTEAVLTTLKENEENPDQLVIEIYPGKPETYEVTGGERWKSSLFSYHSYLITQLKEGGL